MLQITIPAIEVFDETCNEFIITKEQTIQLEHSLVSISKWESKWAKPFLSKNSKTTEETFDYIKCMTITQNVSNDTYTYLTTKNIEEINKYIDAEMTATTFSNNDKTVNRDIITAEIIYYWMISFTIPFECQKWHLNRLLTLINVCNIKNKPPKKMNKREQASRNTNLNEERKRQMALNKGSEG
jgi:hypothetical protein